MQKILYQYKYHILSENRVGGQIKGKSVRFSGSAMRWGAFYCHGLGPLAPFEGRVFLNRKAASFLDQSF